MKRNRGIISTSERRGWGRSQPPDGRYCGRTTHHQSTRI